MKNRDFRVAFLLSLSALFLAVAVWFIYRPDLAIKVGTASIAQTLCDEVFVAGLDATRVFNEEILPDRGLKIILKRLHYSIDYQRRQVVTGWANHFASVASDHEPYGCTLDEPADIGSNQVEAVAHTPPIAPKNQRLAEALDRAFAEPSQPPYRQVRAIVVMQNGQIMAERYASGITPETPLLGYSAAKSVINALIGILVREHKLDLYAPAPVTHWKALADPRHSITLDQLLRMSSGLKLDELDTGFDPVSRMLFTEPDMAGYAERASLKHRPGEAWQYTSGNTLIACSLVRDAVGGHRDDVLRFANRELFAPAGMQRVTMEFDHAGTPIGSTRILAPARAWARFGNLYLNDGVIDGTRILPEGWVAYSTKPTLGTDYGSGFWLNVGPVNDFFASGKYGQRIVVIPRHQLVIVRFGVTIDPPTFDIRGLVRLVSDVVAASSQ